MKMQHHFGNWPSPITADMIAQGVKKFGDCQANDDCLYWTESVAAENGRMTLKSWSEETGTVELLQAPYSVRSKVHEYGGRALLVSDNRIFFINDKDQCLYEIIDGLPKQITNMPNWRFADMDYDPARNRLIAVGEFHDAQSHHPENSIISIKLDQEAMITNPDLVVRGADFFACPRISPDSQKLVFLSWNLPDMPWDGARAYIKTLSSDEAPEALTNEADRAFQPHWLNATQIAMIIERAENGKGKLFILNIENNEAQVLELSEDIDIDLFLPLWQFGMASYAIDFKGSACVAGFDSGHFRLHYTQSQSVVSTIIPGYIDRINMIAGLPAGILNFSDTPQCIARLKIDHGKLKRQVISANTKLPIDRNSISAPRLIQFEAGHLVGNALYYPPTLEGIAISDAELPPMIVSAHGGPTGFANRGFDPKIQYYTSRGFAYLDVDYRGSAGYGRAYREALDGGWGVADVQDIIAATEMTLSQGLADPHNLFISGSSAGGFSVLATLVSSQLFKAGVSRYGIGDLLKLEETTHKFEAGYIKRLIGVRDDMSMEERQALYHMRSPLYHSDKITSPVLFLQGQEDKVVPPSQAEMMIKALKAQNIPVAYRLFEGEGHGFRKPEHVKEAIELEYNFYANALNIDLGENAVQIPWV